MIKAIAFDLDDTLLDTSGILAPQACKSAFENLINNGLNLSLQQCEAFRVEMIKKVSHRDVFEALAHKYGNQQTIEAVARSIQLFYEPILPPSLPLLNGALENLTYLKNKYPLFLVTAGNLEAQHKKVQALNIEKFFQEIFVVDSLKKVRKKDSLLAIIEKLNIANNELLCIGNSISSEIKDALAIGAVACHFDFGENRGELEDLSIKPQFTIKEHSDLLKVCQL